MAYRVARPFGDFAEGHLIQGSDVTGPVSVDDLVVIGTLVEVEDVAAPAEEAAPVEELAPVEHE